MADLPPLIRSGPLRGVWLRIRHQPPAPPEVDVDFADPDAPPGPGWTWVDEGMVHARIEQPVGSGTPPPPELQPDQTRLVGAAWDETSGEWTTDPTAGLAQLDTGDDPPNANVPTHETRPPT
jgi:hypothetical protein